MSARRSNDDADSAAAVLEHLAKQAVDTAKKARKHRASLSGDNFYGNKLANLRLGAARAFEEFAAQSTGDAVAVAELIGAIFDPSTAQRERLNAYRELSFSLQTTWRKASANPLPQGTESFFPPSILAQANRGYISSIGRQMNACYTAGCRDACSVLMRRLLEIGIIEAFEHNGVANKIKDAQDNYFHLSQLVDLALVEPAFTLSRSAKKALPKLRDAGHLSAHGRRFLAAPEDLEKMRSECRIVLEEFFHLSGLLN
jgi:hypothetical protein